MKDILKEYEAEADAIQKALLRWRGMTLNEARENGFGEREFVLQNKLWELGYKICDLKSKIRKLNL